MKKMIVAGVVLLFAGLAWAVAESVERDQSPRPHSFEQGIYLGKPTSRVTTDTANKLASSCGAQIDYTFPALHDDGGTTGSAHFYSAASDTCEGAQVGDPCLIGYMAPLPATTLDDSVECIVTAANTVKLRRAGVRGSDALADAGYRCRCFGRTSL